MSTEMPSVTEQLINASLLLSYPGQTSCLSLFRLVYRFVSEITRLLHRKRDRPSCGEKDCEIPLWSIALKYIQVKFDKHPHHSFLLTPRVVNNNEINQNVGNIQYTII